MDRVKRNRRGSMEKTNSFIAYRPIGLHCIAKWWGRRNFDGIKKHKTVKSP